MYIVAAFYNPLPWQANAKRDDQLMNRTKDYFYNQILNCDEKIKKGELGDFNFPVFCSFVVGWVIIFMCLKNGISTTLYLSIKLVLKNSNIFNFFKI